MGCNSEYMRATPIELALSRVYCLHDELAGLPINKSHWDGYHPNAYSTRPSTAELDFAVAQLCAKLATLDVTQYSLEMQIWWRDHQAADKARLLQEAELARDKKARDELLASLTPYQRRLLGVKED